MMTELFSLIDASITELVLDDLVAMETCQSTHFERLITTSQQNISLKT